MSNTTELRQVQGEVPNLQGMLDLLSSDELADYWRFASSATKALTHNSIEHKQFCLSIKDAERSSRSALPARGLPQVARRLSATDLQRAIVRLKERLLETPAGLRFAMNQFGYWIQDRYREPLLAVLDAMRCPHDEVGTLAGEVPEFSAEQAGENTIKLADVHHPRALALVCGALILNGHRNGGAWNNLASALADLKVRSCKPGSSVLIEANAKTPLAVSIEAESEVAVDDNPVMNLALVRDRFAALKSHLSSAIQLVDQGEAPDLSAAISLARSISVVFQDQSQNFGSKIRSLTDWEQAFALNASRAAVARVADKCEALVHVSDPCFAGLTNIAQVCSELRLAVGVGSMDNTDRLLDGATALLQVVAEGGELDDLEADRLDSLIRSTFGRVVATAALRGNLVHPTRVGVPMLVPPPGCVSPALDVKSTSGLEAEANELGADTTSSESASNASPARSSEGPPCRPSASNAMPSTSRDESEAERLQIEQVDGYLSEEVREANQPEQKAGEQRPCNAEPESLGKYLSYRPDFTDRFWIDREGAVNVAPWRSPNHLIRLLDASASAWDRGRIDLAYLFARGASACGGTTPIDLLDLAHADSFLDAPSSLSSGCDLHRVERLRATLHGPDSGPMRSLGLSLMLEAIRPTLPTDLSVEEVDQLVARANYKDPALPVLVSWMLRAWLAGANPLPQLRERIVAAPPEDPAELRRVLFDAEERFRETVATYWSAAGGRLQRTHCRQAWSKFIQQEVSGLRNDFGRLSSATRLNATNLQNSIRARLPRMRATYAEVMDRAEVRFQDRNSADAAAAQIADSLLQMAEVLQRIAHQEQRTRTAFDACPEEEARRVTHERSSDATDQVCAVLFQAAISRNCDVNPLRLPGALIARVPDLVKYFQHDSLRRLGRSSTVAVDSIDDQRIAASLVLDLGSELNAGDDVEDIARVVREFAIEHDRRDILSALSPTDVLETHERTLLLRSALEVGERLFSGLAELENLWGVCEELMVDDEAELRKVVEEARQLARSSERVNSLLDGRLVERWMKLSLDLAARNVQAAIQARVQLAHNQAQSTGDAVEGYFKQGRYREAMALLHAETSLEVVGTAEGSRQTFWRTDAIGRFDDSAHVLLKELNGKTKEQQALVRAWVDSPQQSGARDQLHKLLYAVVSGEADRSKTDTPKRSVVKLTDLREHRDRKTLVDCATLRDYFHAAGLNPTFLPQLADLGKIVITASGSSVSRGMNALDDWARIVAGEPDQSLVVFLEPGLHTARRDELSIGLRRRGLRAAIIDDIDLCRLCTAVDEADGPAFVALLEILLEQLDLERVSPFSTHDGQHVRVETYVGRALEAETLALRGKYSRIFSGRKLGKSALLKYVATRYDQHRLPSGSRLHVIFITIAGGESEQWVASCIVEEMVRRFELPEGETPSGQRPRDRLSSYMKRLLQSRTNDSVLLILDEADTFVEGQLASYDEDREASLSFCLLKELPAHVDANGLPRIRTIFSGYRVTNTRDGVWANAGDVLVLHPLQEVEATKFIVGALARIGVDIGEHAPYIARRCGRQPAVLIRFGEALLKHLSRVSAGAARESTQVSESIVTAALTDQGVMDEIRTVVANNFQGNRVGQAIFGATLLGLKDLAPGHALTNGPTQVIEKLKEIDSDLGWLERIDASPTAVVERNLQEFIDRELLTVSDSQRFGVREYRLKFPHFLPVLTQAETGLEVRKLIRSIRDSHTTSRLSRCALSETALDKVRYWYREGTADMCSLVVVGGHWASSLVDSKSGLADRLGCGPDEIARDPLPADVGSLVDRGVRVFLQPRLEAWSTFLAVKPPRPIVVVGGISWLRLAMANVLEGGEVPIEVIGQGRLPEETLRWWLEGARALHFLSASATDAFVCLTGGVPLLVAAFDKSLLGDPASAPSEEDVRRALDDYHFRLNQIADSLSDPASVDGLTPRERELLSMAVRVASEINGSEFGLEGDFAEYWDLCAPDESEVARPMSLPEDRLALQILIASGLLPVTDESASLGQQGLGRVRIDPSGPIARLATKLRAVGAS